MRVAAKLVGSILLTVIAILSVDGFLTVQREVKLFEREMKRNARLLGHAMKGSVVEVWRTQGQDAAMRLIDEANLAETLVHLRWVWLDAEPGDLYRPRVPRARIESVLDGMEASLASKDRDGHGYLYTYVPVVTASGRRGALELSESLSLVNSYTRTSIHRTLVLVAVLIATSGILLLVIGVWTLGRPLHLLAEKVRRVGAGDLSGPLPLKGHDELTEVAVSVNDMCERLGEAHERVRAETASRIAALEQLRHADRLQTIGEFSSGIAHELGTPLNVVSGRAGLIASGKLSPSEIDENAGIIKAQCARMTGIIQRLLDFARRRTAQRAPVDLRQILKRTAELVASVDHENGARVVLAGEDKPVMAIADAGQIEQVLTNLMVNALHATPCSGRIELGIRTQRVRAPESHGGSEGEFFCIYVRDEGEGIPKNLLPHLFEPFFTTKQAGKGTGLGLSVADGIVREHGGWIDIQTEPGKGSCFTVYLPEGASG